MILASILLAPYGNPVLLAVIAGALLWYVTIAFLSLAAYLDGRR